MGEVLVFGTVGAVLYGMYRMARAMQPKDELELRRKAGTRRWVNDQYGQQIPITVPTNEKRRYKG